MERGESNATSCAFGPSPNESVTPTSLEPPPETAGVFARRPFAVSPPGLARGSIGNNGDLPIAAATAAGSAVCCASATSACSDMSVSKAAVAATRQLAANHSRKTTFGETVRVLMSRLRAP
jgi:hypothetical protein